MLLRPRRARTAPHAARAGGANSASPEGSPQASRKRPGGAASRAATPSSQTRADSRWIITPAKPSAQTAAATPTNPHTESPANDATPKAPNTAAGAPRHSTSRRRRFTVRGVPRNAPNESLPIDIDKGCRSQALVPAEWNQHHRPSMSEPAFTVVDPDLPGARRVLTDYFEELSARFPEGFDVAAALEDAADAYKPPRGVFVVAGDLERPVACAAVTFLDDERGEIKRMWVAPGSRGRGLASRLLSHLEGLITEWGRTTAVLDTNRVLTDAVALYERRGYEPVERYNDNPYAHHWFRKTLVLTNGGT